MKRVACNNKRLRNLIALSKYKARVGTNEISNIKLIIQVLLNEPITKRWALKYTGVVRVLTNQFYVAPTKFSQAH